MTEEWKQIDDETWLENLELELPFDELNGRAAKEFSLRINEDQKEMLERLLQAYEPSGDHEANVKKQLLSKLEPEQIQKSLEEDELLTIKDLIGQISDL